MLMAVVEFNSVTLSQSEEKIFGILAVLEIILSIVQSVCMLGNFCTMM
jgi:hypothetical protein